MNDLIITPRETAAEEERQEEDSVAQASPLPSKLIYEIIRREGEEELARSNRSLNWSGVAAGLMMSFSVLGEAIFQAWGIDFSMLAMEVREGED